MSDREVNAARAANNLPPITGKNRSSIRMEINLGSGQKLVVDTHVTTGSDPKTRPGISFDLISPYPPLEIPSRDGARGTNFQIEIGVMGRDDVRRLRNLLTEFMLDFSEDDTGV